MGKHTLTLTQKVITFTQIISAVIIVVVTVTLAGVSYQKTDLDGDQARVDELLTNWGNGPILAMKVVTTDSCGDGWTAAYSKTWPGTDSDCWCGDATAADKTANGVTCDKFCSGSCSSAQEKAGCKTIASQPSVNLKYWGVVSGANSQLCLKRSTSESWKTNGVVSRDSGATSCPDGYTTCGFNTTNRYCTKEASCPYVGFAVSSLPAALPAVTLATYLGLCASGKFPPDATKPTVMVDCVVLENDPTTLSYKILLAFKASEYANAGLPISQFAVNEYGMCYTKAKDNITPGREEYFQLSSKRTTCNQEAADLWKSLNSITEEKLFKVNGLSSFVSSVSSYDEDDTMDGYYPTGKTGANYNYDIYQQPYVPWNPEYKDELDTFFKNTDLIPRIKQSQKGYLSMTVIGGGFLCFVVFIELLKLCGKVNPNGWVNKMKRGIRFLALFAQIPLILWSLLLVSVGRHYFEKISSEKVTGEHYVDDNFALFAEHLTQARASTITCFCVVVACLILDLVLYCMWRRAEKKAKQNSGVQRIESEQNNINVK